MLCFNFLLSIILFNGSSTRGHLAPFERSGFWDFWILTRLKLAPHSVAYTQTYSHIFSSLQLLGSTCRALLFVSGARETLHIAFNTSNVLIQVVYPTLTIWWQFLHWISFVIKLAELPTHMIWIWWLFSNKMNLFNVCSSNWCRIRWCRMKPLILSKFSNNIINYWKTPNLSHWDS